MVSSSVCWSNLICASYHLIPQIYFCIPFLASYSAENGRFVIVKLTGPCTPDFEVKELMRIYEESHLGKEKQDTSGYV